MKKTANEYSGVWRDLFRIVDGMRVHNSDAQDKIFYRLTFNQLRMIHRVYTYQNEHNSRGISLKALAERLGITPAAASEMVDTLVRKGVLTRSVDPVDRRAISIIVADELQMRFRATEEAYDECFLDFIGTLDENERDVFVQVIRRLAVYAKDHFDVNNGKGLDS